MSLPWQDLSNDTIKIKKKKNEGRRREHKRYFSDRVKMIDLTLGKFHSLFPPVAE